MDEADLLHAAEQQRIEELCGKLLKEEHIPIVVVTIPSLAKYDASNIESYARGLFHNWGIGSQAHNYGVLLLVSVGDRKARIELGAAWGHDKDDTARMIMNDIIIPNFKKGDYSSGILQGAQALDTMARGNTVLPHSQRARALGLGSAGFYWNSACRSLVVGVSCLRRKRQLQRREL